MPGGLTVEAMDNSERRVAAARERGEARKERFLNARTRTIGVDVAALDRQVAENSTRGAAEAEEERMLAERNRYINSVIEQREAEEREARKREAQQLKNAWDTHAAEPKNNAMVRADPINAKECGASALQRFRGEDEHQYDRARLQAAQMKSWGHAQMAQREAKAAAERDEEDRYASYQAMVHAKRLELEEEERAEAALMRRLAAAENAGVAAACADLKRANAAAESAANLAETEAQRDSALLREDTEVAYQTLDGRVRRDAFKGYSKEQVALFYAENDDIVKEKAAIKAANAHEKAWQAHAEGLNAAMELTDRAAREAAVRTAAEQKAYLLAQAEEGRAKRAAAKAESKESGITQGFFDGFGCSVR